VAELSGGRWEAHLPPTVRQWIAAVALVLLSWGLLTGYALVNMPAYRHQHYLFWQGTAGFLLLVVTVGYVIFLRVQSTPLEITPSAITLLGRRVPRGQVELRRWRHLLHEGALLVLPGPDGPLRLGVSHRLPAPALRPLWQADAQVDAILSPPDFSDVADILGAGHLGWEPPVPGWRQAAIAPWLLTIAFFCGFGALLALTGLGMKLTTSLSGLVFVQTVCFGGAAVGITFTAARARVGRTRAGLEPRSALAPVVQANPPAAAARRRPSFLRAAAAMIAWVVVSTAIAGVIATPVVVITKAFEQKVDIPACRATCAAHGLSYTSFASSKSGTFCRCGEVTFHEHTNVLGGHGFLAGLLDWLIRSVVLVGGMLAWIGLIIGAVVVVGKARERR
jgi:hypothetical protein